MDLLYEILPTLNLTPARRDVHIHIRLVGVANNGARFGLAKTNYGFGTALKNSTNAPLSRPPTVTGGNARM